VTPQHHYPEHLKKRITLDDTLRHPFLAQRHSSNDELTVKSAFDFGFEDEKLHRVKLQELIWQEVGNFWPFR
jgi:mitogen-activated protein kinase 1/3